mgnify:CR=1 FL=1
MFRLREDKIPCEIGGRKRYAGVVNCFKNPWRIVIVSERDTYEQKVIQDDRNQVANRIFLWARRALDVGERCTMQEVVTRPDITVLYFLEKCWISKQKIE